MSAFSEAATGQPPVDPQPAQPEAGGGQPPQQEQGNQEQQGQAQGAEALLTGSASADQTDAIYDQEFQRFLADETTGAGGQPPQVGQQSGQQAGQPQPQQQPQPGQQQGVEGGQAGGQGDGQQGQDAATRAGLSEEQKHLLQRNHLTPEAVESLPQDQRQGFLDNLSKREQDTQAEINRLKQLAGESEGQQGNQQGQQDGGEQRGEGQQGTEAQGGQEGQLASAVEQAGKQLTDTFGEEAKPFADQAVHLAKTVESSQQQLQQAQQANQKMQGLVADLTLQSAADALSSEYPSLQKPEARQKVLERFRQEWPNSSQRQGEGPIIDRIRAAMKDVASREFGNVTESQAAASLAQRTEQRLQQQPDPGQGAHRPAELKEDDIYDQAFETHLKPDLQSA